MSRLTAGGGLRSPAVSAGGQRPELARGAIA
jgi:hypothetical protein